MKNKVYKVIYFLLIIALIVVVILIARKELTSRNNENLNKEVLSEFNNITNTNQIKSRMFGKISAR